MFDASVCVSLLSDRSTASSTSSSDHWCVQRSTAQRRTAQDRRSIDTSWGLGFAAMRFDLFCSPASLCLHACPSLLFSPIPPSLSRSSTAGRTRLSPRRSRPVWSTCRSTRRTTSRDCRRRRRRRRRRRPSRRRSPARRRPRPGSTRRRRRCHRRHRRRPRRPA